ncbi:SDR family NAD(P)-dependent oxidoreductase [Ruminococcus sp. OM08-7]|nr:SDR family NAD(P)-dependent oxidoreductase [Ruminococcus sp. OM08-7]
MGIKSKVKNIIAEVKKPKLIPIVTHVRDDSTLENKVALIAGGNGGIGMAIAREYIQAGCKIILGGANIIKLEACVKELQSDRVKPLILNLNEVDSFDKKIEQAEEMFGGIDIFVNAAGVHTENVDFWSVTSDEYDRVMNINLKGAYFFCRELAKYWVKKQKRGHILLISSVRGSEPAWSPYGISKWGLNGMTIGLAKMLTSQGIIVNAIAPGSTATPLIGINQGDSIYTEDNSSKRMLMPEEIGEYARLLVSDAGDMLAGETIHISSGRGIWDIR